MYRPVMDADRHASLQFPSIPEMLHHSLIEYVLADVENDDVSHFFLLLWVNPNMDFTGQPCNKYSKKNPNDANQCPETHPVCPRFKFVDDLVDDV
jgi:hypothetical protein